MNALLMSLVSGLVGVLVGTFIQNWYIKKNEKYRLVEEYKKICVSEWTQLYKEIHTLIKNPQSYNNLLFRQIICLKKTMLSFFTTINKKYKTPLVELEKLIDKIDENLSLSDFAEEALNKGKVDDNKKKLLREVLTLSTKVIKKIITF